MFIGYHKVVMISPRTISFHNHSIAFVIIVGEDSRVFEGEIRDRVQLRKESDVDTLGFIEVHPYLLPILPKK